MGQISVDTGTFLKGIDMFDNVEFGISTKDAISMAPSTRKLLEHSFLALLDSGIDYRARDVGCYTAGSPYDIAHITDPVSALSHHLECSNHNPISNKERI